jgi:hypothetical protein
MQWLDTLMGIVMFAVLVTICVLLSGMQGGKDSA